MLLNVASRKDDDNGQKDNRCEYSFDRVGCVIEGTKVHRTMRCDVVTFRLAKYGQVNAEKLMMKNGSFPRSIEFLGSGNLPSVGKSLCR